MDQIQHKFIDARGLKLHFAEIGTGPCVVFLHGFPEIWYSWRHQMIALANAGFRAIAPDLRGYGLSEKHPQLEKASFNDLVEDTIALLDSCHIDKAFLIGKDMGAFVVYLVSLLYPTRVFGVVSLGVPFFIPQPNRYQSLPEGFYIKRRKVVSQISDFLVYLVINEWNLKMLRQISVRFSVKTVVRNIYILFSRSEIPIADKDGEIMDLVDSSTPLPPWFSGEDLDACAKLYETSGFTSTLQVPYRSHVGDLSIINPKVEVPALLIMGGKDYFLKFPGVEEYITSGKVKEYMPNMEMEFLSDGTHFVQEQFPQEANQRITNFINKHVGLLGL